MFVFRAIANDLIWGKSFQGLRFGLRKTVFALQIKGIYRTHPTADRYKMLDIMEEPIVLHHCVYPSQAK